MARNTAQAFIMAYMGLLAFNAVALMLPAAGPISIPIGDHGLVISVSEWLRLASPCNGLWQDPPPTPLNAIVTLTCSIVVAALLLACAIRRLPRTLQDEPVERQAWRTLAHRFIPT